MNWTIEQEDELEKLWQTHSLRQLAALFRVSRQSVSGKMHRMRKKGRQLPRRHHPNSVHGGSRAWWSKY